MRLITYVGYCDEVGETEYAANEVTYLSNTPGMVGAEKHQLIFTCDMGGSLAEPQSSYDLIFPIGAILPQYMRQTGENHFPTRPEDSPFFHAHHVQFWDFF